MLKRFLVVFILCLPLVQPLYAQISQTSLNSQYQSRWQEADSLMQRNMPESAARVAQAILKDAEMQHAAAQIIKAQLFLMNTDQKEEGSATENIRKAERYIASADNAVTKAIWQSITAEMYWNYFRDNRYKFYNRTVMAETVSDDIDTWDPRAFTQKVSALYTASIEDRTVLQSIPVDTYAPIILEGKNTRKLRPTVYDLLVFRAISFFENDEKDIINPADKFEIGGMPWFDNAARFSEVRVKVSNANSLHFQALRLYQEIIAFHLEDKDPSALIDADIRRLAFVHNNSVTPDKDSLYLQALQQLEQKYAAFPAAAQASYLIALQLAGNEPVRTYGRVLPKAQRKNRNLPAIKEKLQGIIAKYPETEGGINAHNLLLSLEEKTVDIKTEEVNLPGEPVKALVTYKNMSTVYLKLYKVPQDIHPDNYYDSNESILKKLYELQPVKSWAQTLPGSEDMEQHSSEITAGVLSAGAYKLVVSFKDNLSDEDNIISMSAFQVSGLSFIMEREGQTTGYVLNRKSGYPVTGTKATFWSQNYNSQKNRYETKVSGNAVTDAKGRLTLPVTGDDYSKRISDIILFSGDDTLHLNGYFNTYSYQDNKESDHINTFFFTDRSLYRPGQTIYFKGIMVRSSNQGRKNEVASNQMSTVSLHDANGQKIASLDLVTNAFGSFSGKFTAPEGGMGGHMHIENGTGGAYFSVEEYKRPKFFVEFDSLRDNYALNETVTVKGNARAFAGNNIDGANVKYRVVRRARFPYYWCYYRWGMPASPEMEITNGEAVTQEDGSFEISFTTIPDRSVDPQSLPVFTYMVYADITDVNGETRSGNTSVNCGYRSLQIATSVPEESTPKELDTLMVRTENLNGIFTAAMVKITVSRLKFPGFLRKRLWEMPDQFALSEEAFRKLFPADEYKEEGNYLNWEKESALYEKTIITTPEGQLAIPEATWYKNGWYVIEISGKDAQGNEILEKKYTYVWTPGKRAPNQKEISIYTDREQYEPGMQLDLWVATAAESPYLLRKVKASGNEDLEHLAMNPLQIKISEEDRGGMVFSWLYVYNNRVYTANRTINIPWDNKDLELEWATHRDKLQPGANEEWTLTVRGNKKEQVAAEVLAGMYDASLDAFRNHYWNWNKLFPSVYMYDNWNHSYGFGIVSGQMLHYRDEGAYKNFDKRYDRMVVSMSDYESVLIEGSPVLNEYSRDERLDGAKVMAAAPGNIKGTLAPAAVDPGLSAEMSLPLLKEKEELPLPSSISDIRTNFKETAFFLPQLETDTEGNVKFKFMMPEALTEWRMMAFAHTKDWKTGYLEGKVKTQKDLMVMPGLPRFLRQNDDIVLSTKISNLSNKLLTGEVRLELMNAITHEPVNIPFRIKDHQQAFKVAAGQSTTACWSLHVPESMYVPVIVRIVAKAGDFSDGEESALPVITNRTLVTETLPLSVRGAGEKTFTLDRLVNQTSNTISNHALTVEYTGNPAWYAVQALPYLIEYPYECAEQTFNRFYANALAGHIVFRSPRIGQIFAQWKESDTAALLSNLQKNEALKSALLEETPWVMEAKNEGEQKRRIASLFETHKLSLDIDRNLDKLEQMQLPEGGFPWFKGMRSDRYITQYIITGIGRLRHLGIKDMDKGSTAKIIKHALPYLDRLLQEDYHELVKQKIKLDEQHISYMQVQYLYMRSFYKDNAIPAVAQKAFDYYKAQAAKYWPSFNPYMEGQIALALNRLGDTKIAQQIIASLKETSIRKEETGMYWQNMPAGYWWYEAPIEAQSLLIEAFSEVAKDNTAVDALKVWLLKQKQTQTWATTKATADACYALLLQGSDWLTEEPVVTVSLGKSAIIQSSEINTEAGTGYFKKKYTGQEVKNDMGNIKINVETAGNKKEGVSWGAVYWQYFEDIDKITAAATPLSIKKQLFIERNSDRGPVLTEIKEGNELQVGDKVKIRIEIKSDRDMEYVHLKDMRASCFEPVNVLSSYRYQGGIGYYERTKDVSTSFFFDYLRKGTYIFEYPVFITSKGNFSSGIAKIQCMYAPEFSSHTAGSRVVVK